MSESFQGINSRLVHVGEQPDPRTGAAIPPIYQTTTFAFPTNESMLDVMEGRRSGYIYTRYGNPGFALAEEKIADLEGAEGALVLASGMAAISTAVMALCGMGDHVLTHPDIYGGSFGLFHDLLPRFGIETSFADLQNLESVESGIRENTKVLFVESPSNPTLRIFDLRALSEIAHRRGVIVVADNTFGTPFNQLPLALGVDAVVHSGTKYLNGHSDVMAGAIAGKKEYIERCTEVFRKFGGNLNGFDAWLLIRGMKTFGLRMQRHNESALEVAKFLSGHPSIERVHYPGLPTHPGHELAKTQMKGFAGVLSIDLKGGAGAIDRFLDRVQLFSRAVSLGSVESLITQPVAAVHHSVPEEFRRQVGIGESLVRISVGIEEVEDILHDLDQALRPAL